MWAYFMERVCNVVTHCSKTTGSHTWARTRAARCPTQRSSHAACLSWAGGLSWEWANETRRWGAVSCCFPYMRHVLSSTVPHEDNLCAMVSDNCDGVHAVRPHVALVVLVEQA